MNCTIEEYVKNHLLTKYELVYNKVMDIRKEGDSYSLYMELNNVHRPLMMGGDFESDEDFAKYITKEIDKREIFKTKYFIIKMTDENKQI